MYSRVAFTVLSTAGLTLPPSALFDPFGSNRIELAKTEIAILTKAAESYKTKTGAYPAKLQDLVEGGYVMPRDRKKLIDPWDEVSDHFQIAFRIRPWQGICRRG